MLSTQYNGISVQNYFEVEFADRRRRYQHQESAKGPYPLKSRRHIQVCPPHYSFLFPPPDYADMVSGNDIS